MAPGNVTPFTFSGPFILAPVEMGGKPSKGTKKDRRLRPNKKPKKSK